MTSGPPVQRRLAFGEVAELYEQVRPSYPGELIDQVLAYAQLEPGDRILEVGAGTGKATRQFAASGHPIVALEPSAEMAGVARGAIGDLSSVTVVQVEFERWVVPSTRFKLVISAQAWHWIDPDVRYAKAREALKPRGTLAAFWTHADWQRAPLGPVLDQAYREAAPDFAPSGPMHPRTRRGDLVPHWETEINAAGGFERAEVRSFPWRHRYRTQDYVRLLSTHSDHLVLEPEVRARLLQHVGDAIEAHGGTLELPYVSRLCLARAV